MRSSSKARWRGAPPYPRSPDTLIAAFFFALLIGLLFFAIGHTMAAGARLHPDRPPGYSPTPSPQ